ncbi:ATP-binding protein [Magnetovibrio blakemorei]|uniref:histidine kinase n=1 Tax=Magnetovibrio blakemorei TaxID=28181 RepID=A0A1E5QBD2_9PROT|nr:ATP-binding protein [Magnetovibrio blakemorei]OEJ69328.1 hypothetical protein BEN30_04430 [Magnetovibrio blakemorei]
MSDIVDKKTKNLALQLLPMQLLSVVIVALLAWFFVPYYVEKSAEEQAALAAEQVARNFLTLRTYYTDNVVNKVLNSDGNLIVDHGHKTIANAIPLPASLIFDMGELLKDSQVQLKFYSPFPFENRKDRQLDAYGQAAWLALTQNPNTPYVQHTKMNGQEVVRLAVADRMTSQVCIDCHNSHPLSPKKDWHLGDVRGVLEISSNISSQVSKGHKLGLYIVIGFVVLIGGMMAMSFRITFVEFDKWSNARKIHERELSDASMKANAASKAKSVFLANMSHELRTPLNAIIGYSEILSKGILGKLNNAKHEEYALDIYNCGNHLLNLINDILDISKIEAKKEELSERIIEVRLMMETSLQRVRPLADQKGITLSIDVPDHLPGLLCDERRVVQVLINLLNNAIKFTNMGGHVDFTSELDGAGRHVVKVSDNGRGIAQEHLSRIIMPFEQIGDAFDSPQEGTGLGLTICKSLMKLHGGDLEISSELGTGTTVTVTFPPERTVPDTTDPGQNPTLA